MRVEFCDLCKVNSDLPEGCISCAYKSERDQRMKLDASCSICWG